MGLLLYKRYGCAIVFILTVVLIVARLLNEPIVGNNSDPFITVLTSIDADADDPQWSFVESDLVNLTDFQYTLKAQVCNDSVEDILGKICHGFGINCIYL